MKIARDFLISSNTNVISNDHVRLKGVVSWLQVNYCNLYAEEIDIKGETDKP